MIGYGQGNHIQDLQFIEENLNSLEQQKAKYHTQIQQKALVGTEADA